MSAPCLFILSIIVYFYISFHFHALKFCTYTFHYVHALRFCTYTFHYATMLPYALGPSVIEFFAGLTGRDMLRFLSICWCGHGRAEHMFIHSDLIMMQHPINNLCAAVHGIHSTNEWSCFAANFAAYEDN